jgi:hypothetical protein
MVCKTRCDTDVDGAKPKRQLHRYLLDRNINISDCDFVSNKAATLAAMIPVPV